MAPTTAESTSDTTHAIGVPPRRRGRSWSRDPGATLGSKAGGWGVGTPAGSGPVGVIGWPSIAPSGPGPGIGDMKIR